MKKLFYFILFVFFPLFSFADFAPAQLIKAYNIVENSYQVEVASYKNYINLRKTLNKTSVEAKNLDKIILVHKKHIDRLTKIMTTNKMSLPKQEKIIAYNFTSKKEVKTNLVNFYNHQITTLSSLDKFDNRPKMLKLLNNFLLDIKKY